MTDKRTEIGRIDALHTETVEGLLDAAYRSRMNGGVERERALKLEEQAAEQGSDNALWTLALRYRYGIGVPQDADKALQYLNFMKDEPRYAEKERAALLAQIGARAIAKDIYYVHWKMYDDNDALCDFIRLFDGEELPADYLAEIVEYAEKNGEDTLLPAADILTERGLAEGNTIRARILAKIDRDVEEDVVSQYRWGEAYEYGIGVKKDIDLADVWYEKAFRNVYLLERWLKSITCERERKMILRALAGHIKRYRLYGEFVAQTCFSWFKRWHYNLWEKCVAEKNREERAQTYIHLANTYPKDTMPRKKAAALRRAIRLGNGTACLRFAQYYETLGKKGLSRRIRYLKKGVKLYDAESMFYLGYLLSERTSPSDRAEAFRLTKLAADRGKDRSAMKNLALFYQKGLGVEKNVLKATEIFRRVFEENTTADDARTREIANSCGTSVALAYLFGEEGVPQDVRRAILWFRKLAAVGDAVSMYNLGSIYFNDEYERENDALCRQWFDRAERNGYQSADGEMYVNLGYYYHYGVECKQDLNKALTFYRRGAEKGNKRGAFNLAVLYSQQLCDPESAIAWYRKSLERGESLSALNNLANCLKNKDCPDLTDAERIYRRILEISPAHSYTIGYAYSNLADLMVDPHREVADWESAKKYMRQAIDELEETIRLHEAGEDVAWNSSVYGVLARFYLDDRYGKPNLGKAERYAVKGAKTGNYNAQQLCKKQGWKY